MHSVLALGRARAGILNTVEALSNLVLVAGAQTQNPAASVKLVAHIFVHLAELVKFASDIVVLDLDDLGVLLERVLLGEEVNVLAAEHCVGGLVGVKVFPLNVKLVLAVLETSL